jgi:hypothetical protein
LREDICLAHQPAQDIDIAPSAQVEFGRQLAVPDIPLDSPLRSLALRNPDLADMIANATRRAFVRIVDLCLKERVDALLLAGDLYDGDQTSMKTARFFSGRRSADCMRPGFAFTSFAVTTTRSHGSPRS